MAKQGGHIVFEGTIGGICFYAMNGLHFARAASSLDGERVKRDPAFAGLMRYSDWLKLSSPMAARLYRTLPKDKRQKSQYRALAGLGIRLFKEGYAVEQVYAAMEQEVEQLRGAMLPETERVEEQTAQQAPVAHQQQAANSTTREAIHLLPVMDSIIELPVKQRIARPAKRKNILNLIDELENPVIDPGTDLKELFYQDIIQPKEEGVV
jgi:hypothetical protein